MDDKLPYITAAELAEAKLTIRPSTIWEFPAQPDRNCAIAGDHHWLPVPGDEQPPDMILLVCKHCDVRKEASPDDEY